MDLKVICRRSGEEDMLLRLSFLSSNERNDSGIKTPQDLRHLDC